MTRISLYLTLLLLALFTLPAVQGDTLYKWVDDQGNVHYSDKPQPGATKMHLPKPTTYAAPTTAVPPQPQMAGAGSSNSDPGTGYTRFEIAAPTPEQTFWNVQSITVTLSLQPGLQDGDTVTITLDGKSQGPGTSISATFDGLDRGAHTASATLQKAYGGSMSAKPVTFYIQKATQKTLH